MKSPIILRLDDSGLANPSRVNLSVLHKCGTIFINKTFQQPALRHVVFQIKRNTFQPEIEKNKPNQQLRTVKVIKWTTHDHGKMTSTK